MIKRKKMSTDISSQILNNWTRLTRDVRLQDISGSLIQKRVMTTSEWEELKGKECGETVRMEEFLLKLVRKSEEVRRQFLLALKSGPYSHVYEQIARGNHQVSDNDAMRILQNEVNKLKLQSTVIRDDKIAKDRDIGVLKEKVKQIEEINARIPHLESIVKTLELQLWDKQKLIKTLETEKMLLQDINRNLENQVERLSQMTYSRPSTSRNLDSEMTHLSLLQRQEQDLKQQIAEAKKEKEGLENVKRNSGVCVML